MVIVLLRIATALAVILIPVLYVTVEKLTGGKTSAPPAAPPEPAASHHGAEA